MFSLLTGFLENGEPPETAVVREAQEELGVRAEGVEFIGHFPLRELNQIIIAYVLLRARGTLVLSDEIAEVKMVSPGELAEFDFGPLELTHNIVARWLERNEKASS